MRLCKNNLPVCRYVGYRLRPPQVSYHHLGVETCVTTDEPIKPAYRRLPRMCGDTHIPHPGHARRDAHVRTHTSADETHLTGGRDALRCSRSGRFFQQFLGLMTTFICNTHLFLHLLHQPCRINNPRTVYISRKQHIELNL